MRKGFTLIELLVVVLIIGILAAVALPQYNNTVLKSRTAEAFINLKAMATAQQIYFMTNNSYAAGFEDLDIEIGKNCSGEYCVSGKYEYQVHPTAGNVYAFYQSGEEQADTLTLVYRFAPGTSPDYTNFTQGDYACVPRNKAKYTKVCLSLAGAGYKTSTGFTNGNAYVWR